jgi:serine/threonine protein kinase
LSFWISIGLRVEATGEFGLLCGFLVGAKKEMDPVATAISIVKVLGKIQEAVQQVTANKELCQKFSSRLDVFDVILMDQNLHKHSKFGKLVIRLKCFVDDSNNFISSFLPRPMPKKKKGAAAVICAANKLGNYIKSIHERKAIAQKFLDLDSQLTLIRDDFEAISTIIANADRSFEYLVKSLAKSLKDDLVGEVNKIRDEVGRGEPLPENFESLLDCPNLVQETIDSFVRDNSITAELSDTDTKHLRTFVTKQVDDIITISQMRRRTGGEPVFLAEEGNILTLLEIGDRLGDAGAFGVTHKARDKRNNRIYALKQVNVNYARQLGFDEDLLEREADSLRSLNHSRIVHFYYSFFDDAVERYYIIMELVQGRTMDHFISSRPTISQQLKWFEQLASALVYMHGDCQIIHRDLKPANIMVTDGMENVKIIDFGLSRSMAGVVNGAERMTAGVGTPLYMSYEKLEDLPYDGRDDVWALGCIFLELLLQQELRLVRLAKDDIRRANLIYLAQQRHSAVGNVISAILADKLQANRPTAADVLVLLSDIDLNTGLSINEISFQLVDANVRVRQEAVRALQAMCANDRSKYDAVREAGCIAPLIALLSDADLSVRQNAAAALWYVARNKENKDAIREARGIEPLVALLSDRDETLRRNSAAALCNLAANETNNEVICELGAIEPLVKLLSDAEESIQENASATLWSLSTKISKHDAIREAGGIVRLVELFLSGKNAKVRGYASSALGSLCRNAINKDAIREAGGIKPFVRQLSEGDDTARQKAASALWSLGVNEKNKDEIREMGGIKPLVRLLADGNLKTRQHASAALWTLAVNAANKNAIRDAGGIEPLVQLLSDADVTLRQNATSALLSLAINPTNKVTIGGAGGIPPLVRLLSDEKVDIREKAAGALECLAIEAANRDAIRGAGGIPPLVRLLSDEKEDIREKAAGALGNLAINPTNQDTIRDAGGITSLMKLLTDAKAEKKAKIGLQRMCQENEANRNAVVVEMGGDDILQKLGVVDS